jgi:hypothetical protein
MPCTGAGSCLEVIVHSSETGTGPRQTICWWGGQWASVHCDPGRGTGRGTTSPRAGARRLARATMCQTRGRDQDKTIGVSRTSDVRFWTCTRPSEGCIATTNGPHRRALHQRVPIVRMTTMRKQLNHQAGCSSSPTAPRPAPPVASRAPRTAAACRAMAAPAAAPLEVDVAIAGAGPAGLAAAAALRRADPSLTVHLFERGSMDARGAAILVGVNGLKALHAIDPTLVDRLLAKAIRLEGSGARRARATARPRPRTAGPGVGPPTQRRPARAAHPARAPPQATPCRRCPAVATEPRPIAPPNNLPPACPA